MEILNSSARVMSLFSRPFVALAQAAKVSRHQDRKGILVVTLRISVSPSLPLSMPACQNTTAETCKHANGRSPHLKAVMCTLTNLPKADPKGLTSELTGFYGAQQSKNPVQ